MKSLFGPLLVAIVFFTGVFTTATPTASAQGALTVTLTEDPFLCDTVVRPLGTVAGLVPGEGIEFSSPQLNGTFSRRNADEAGRVAMRWNCDRAQTWTVTVRGLTSGASATFVVTGKTAPPPADAPIGAAFDAKTAMTTAQMAVWKDFSPFNTAGVYIPVNPNWDNRADKLQANLTASWVSTVFADGWSLIPIYVGFQAPDPCQTGRFEGHSLDPATARNQGLAAAADAVESVTRLGMPVGSPIYYDMEAYRTGCSEAVLAFLDAWTEGVKAAGFVSGVYGSRSSTMRDLSQALGRAGFDAPDAVWVSTGNGNPTAYGLEVPTDGQWVNARMHQYRLNITRTYGGVTREIDENIVDAPLARANAPAPVPAQTGVDSDGDGVAEPTPDNCDNVANPDQADLDNDGDGDVCDSDIDGDGVDNVADFAPNDPTVQAAPASTAAPAPDIVDNDQDGFAEPDQDNCDRIANADQADLDNDGDGDVCDSDIDGDGIANADDQDPRDPLVGAAPAPTAQPEPSPTPEATPAPDEPVEAQEPTLEPEPTPEPSPEPTTAPQVIVLPTPLPTVEPATPLPTVNAFAAPLVDEDALADPVTVPAAPPDESIELAADTVTITVEDESALLPYTLAALALASIFCLGMGYRSFARYRRTTI